MIQEIPEDLRPLIKGFRLCLTCFEFYEFRLQGAVTRQRCRCRRDEGATDATWPGSDFNEHLHLCECCSMVPLLSGSKWSVWFCDDCKPRVVALNGSVGHCVVPIGRHSLMNGVGVSTSELVSGGTERRAVVDAFSGKLMSLFDAMQHLHVFAQARRRGLVERLDFPAGEDVALPDWLETLTAAEGEDPSSFGKAVSFEMLVDWFGGWPLP